MSPLKILLISLVGFIVASSALAAISAGDLRYLIAGPLLAILGWFFYPVAVIFVAGQWWVYTALGRSRRAAVWILGVWPAINAGLFMLIGPREAGSEFRWALAYGISAAIGAVTTARLIIGWQPGRAPRGDPSTEP
ncbi:MAG: hypothetical protein AAF612_12055 [Planctomycetota bacterium]